MLDAEIDFVPIESFNAKRQTPNVLNLYHKTNYMKPFFLLISLFTLSLPTVYSWGFYGHERINYYAVFLLPPEMMVLYKPNIRFLQEHSADPDKRRYAVLEEGLRHYIDMDHYGKFPFDSLPRNWKDAAEKFTPDSLQAHGIVPWHILIMMNRLTKAFREKNFASIMKNSAEIGHYISDAHVPLHTSSNHNGQYTNQRGIHGFWESRVPELLAEKEFDFFIGKAAYLQAPGDYIWQRVLESTVAVDSVLQFEKKLNNEFKEDQKYSFENRNGKTIRQYSSNYTKTYNRILDGMVERRMRQSIFSVASFWYTAWVNAGQPDLKSLAKKEFSSEDLADFEKLNDAWRAGSVMIGRGE
jgi:hypothetical protein